MEVITCLLLRLFRFNKRAILFSLFCSSPTVMAASTAPSLEADTNLRDWNPLVWFFDL